MRITKWGEYGVLCSLYLVKINESSQEALPQSSTLIKPKIELKTAGASEISENLGIPIQYTQQILQRLRKGNIIESIRGPKGGYKLSMSPDKITLKDVLSATEGATFEVICDEAPLSVEHCSKENLCGLKDIWIELKSTVDHFLSDKTLLEISKSHHIKFETEKDNLIILNKKESKVNNTID